LNKRVCPKCFARWYSSASTDEAWVCETCKTPIPKVAVEEKLNSGMEQIFIRVRTDEDHYISKDIMDATNEEREKWYETLSKGQVTHVLRQFIMFKEEDKIKVTR